MPHGLTLCSHFLHSLCNFVHILCAHFFACLIYTSKCFGRTGHHQVYKMLGWRNLPSAITLFCCSINIENVTQHHIHLMMAVRPKRRHNDCLLRAMFMAASTEYDRGYVHIATELIYLLIMGNHVGEMWGSSFYREWTARPPCIDRRYRQLHGAGSRDAKNSRLLMWLMGRYKVPCGLPVVVYGREV
jgi:hypothetical protein